MENNIGGVRLVGKFRFGGGQIIQRLIIPCSINAGDIARGAHRDILLAM